MSFVLIMDQERSVINVKVEGPLDNEVRKSILAEIALQIKITGFRRVLVDLTRSIFNPSESMVGALALTQYMDSIGISPDARLAFLYCDAEGHRKYFQKVAQSVGYRLCYFRDRSEGMAWLQEVGPQNAR